MNSSDSVVPLGVYILLIGSPILGLIAYFLLRKHARSKPNPERDISPGPYRSLEDVDPLMLYHYLQLLLLPNSRLFLLEADRQHLVELGRLARPSRWLPSSCEILKDPLGLHIPVSDATLGELSQLMGRVPLNGGDFCQLGWVIIVYDDAGIYFEWINPPDEPVHIASRIPEDKVRTFAEKTKRQRDALEFDA